MRCCTAPRWRSSAAPPPTRPAPRRAISPITALAMTPSSTTTSTASVRRPETPAGWRRSMPERGAWRSPIPKAGSSESTRPATSAIGSISSRHSRWCPGPETRCAGPTTTRARPDQRRACKGADHRALVNVGMHVRMRTRHDHEALIEALEAAPARGDVRARGHRRAVRGLGLRPAVDRFTAPARGEGGSAERDHEGDPRRTTRARAMPPWVPYPRAPVGTIQRASTLPIRAVTKI